MDNSSKGYSIKYNHKVLQLFNFLQCNSAIAICQRIACVISMLGHCVIGFVVVSPFLWRLRSGGQGAGLRPPGWSVVKQGLQTLSRASAPGPCAGHCGEFARGAGKVSSAKSPPYAQLT